MTLAILSFLSIARILIIAGRRCHSDPHQKSTQGGLTMRRTTKYQLILLAVWILGTATLTLAGDHSQRPWKTGTKPYIGQQGTPSDLSSSSSHVGQTGEASAPVNQGSTGPSPAGGLKPYRLQQTNKPTSGTDSPTAEAQSSSHMGKAKVHKSRQVQKADETQASFDPSTLPKPMPPGSASDLNTSGVSERERELSELLSEILKKKHKGAQGALHNIQ